MSLAELSTRRRVTIAMVTLTFVLFGLIALSDLKVNLLPDLSYPTLTVRTEYTGAAPVEIENLITEPVEEALGVVKNVRKVRSISRTSQSDVILEFTWGTDMDMAGLEVRDKLEVLQLPLEAKKPVLLRFDPSTDPILRLGLGGSSTEGAVSEAELKQLRRYADEELKKRIEPIEGVAAVKVGGGLEDEIQVDIDQQRLAQLNLSVGEVVERLRSENVNVSGGRIEEGSQRYLVRTINQFANVDEMREMLIKVEGGVPIRIADIATVRQGFKEREAIIRIDGREAVELAVYKEGDANTVGVAEAVKGQLERLRKTLPQGANLTVVDDQSVFIRQALSSVRTAAFEGGLFAILIIFLFLRDAWSTFVIALSLPVSIIATFFFMGQFGLSLNVMSLGGLALATGMVVDDSIVVLENIARMRERGMGILESAVKGTSEVGMAVTASTLTTVAVFFPLVFVEGVAGQLFRDQALTVTIAMLISLVVAMTLIPTLASLKVRPPQAYPDEPPARAQWRGLLDVVRTIFRWPLDRAWGAAVRWVVFVVTLPVRLAAIVLVGLYLLIYGLARSLFYGIVWLWSRVAGRAGGPVGRGVDRFARGVMWPYERAAAAYHRVLPKALERPTPVLVGALLLFVATMWLVPMLGLDLIPQLQQGSFEVTAKMPPGTPLAETDAVVRELQAKHAKDAPVRTIYGVSGVGTRLDANPTESGENIARLLVAMKPGTGEDGERTEIEALRDSMKAHPGAEVKFSRPQLFSFATPLEVEISGYDLDVLKRAGQDLAQRLEGSDRFADVKSSVEDGYPEVQIRFDQDRAAALGLTTRQIADQVVRKVRGEVATRYSFRDRKIDVLVRASEADRGSVEDIRNLIVNPQSDRPVTLSAVADVVSTEGPSEIRRADQERVAIVSANLAYGDLGTAVTVVEEMLRERPLAAGVGVHIGGQSEELANSVSSLLFALSLAIFLVYLVMASQFESLLHPFVIMFTIPLAAIGAVLALFLTGNPLSVVVFIGLIMLVGIVVKNAIVLIDRVNQLREHGVPKRRAIAEAAESRLRPIMMTTIATLVGFAPLALGIGEGSEVRAPMAIAVIGGLAVSTLLTLLVIPIVYDLMDRRGDEAYVARAGRKQALHAAAIEVPDAPEAAH
ncbi:MAG TPA: efflux RND transporter permease subunit [Candidatus Saccharimonadia bacterium]|nr:efflux RND transporter permease subunit [Candidatus Saccharimonadia bacterium]